MKLIEKLKNVFFEEVPDDEDEEELPQTFAKKIEIPKKPIEPIRSREEVKPIVTLEEAKAEQEELEKEEAEEENEQEDVEETNKDDTAFPMMFDDDDFLEDKKQKEMDDSLSRATLHKEDEEHGLYHGKKETSYIESVRKPNYSYTKSYYEERETREFRPSPIISPVYGILDKNYRKEEVITKKEVKITPTKKTFDLDSVRNKAFGSDDEMISDKKTREAKEETEDKKIYDVNNNKPQVNHVTLADADEYYNDLGLAYNVDYSDASRDNNTGATRSSKYSPKEKRKDKNVDENLFDLIDSMYKEDK